jgi:ABC transporter
VEGSSGGGKSTLGSLSRGSGGGGDYLPRTGFGRLPSTYAGGLLQMVGETGWRLSHGERRRLYIARALLQDAELIILDEGFAALASSETTFWLPPWSCCSMRVTSSGAGISSQERGADPL